MLLDKSLLRARKRLIDVYLFKHYQKLFNTIYIYFNGISTNRLLQHTSQNAIKLLRNQRQVIR